MGLKAEVDAAHHLQLALLGPGLPLLVLRLLGEFGDDQLGHGGLVFHHIRAALLGHQGHLLGQLQAAVVVYTGFRNDQNAHGIAPFLILKVIFICFSTVFHRFSTAGAAVLWKIQLLPSRRRRMWSSSSIWPMSIQLCSLMGYTPTFSPAAR